MIGIEPPLTCPPENGRCWPAAYMIGASLGDRPGEVENRSTPFMAETKEVQISATATCLTSDCPKERKPSAEYLASIMYHCACLEPGITIPRATRNGLLHSQDARNDIFYTAVVQVSGEDTKQVPQSCRSSL
jgi:hypothetical protein